MIVATRCCCVVVLLAAASAATPAVLAQNPTAAGSSYGAGVHAYFAGRTADAEQFLSRAIQENPDDPRPHYFRALSLLRMGRQDEARRGMAAGAAIEARRPGRFAVGTSLQRVQGADRLLLEAYRRQARADESDQRGERRRTLYDQTVGREGETLRQRVSVPLDQLVQPRPLAAWTQGEAGLAPVADSLPTSRPTSGGTTHDLADQAPATADDPFSDDPLPAAVTQQEGAVNPFAIDAAPAAGETDAASGGTIPAEELIGILGRVLRQSAPIPSLDDLREQVPFLPPAAPPDEAPDGDSSFDTPPDAFPGGDATPGGDDQFDFGAEATNTPAAESEMEAGSESTPVNADDPFGGF